MKLLIFLAVWKRPEITEICFMGLNRLRKHPDYDINVLAVISEESMIPLCEKYNVSWVMHENQPLGAKKNFGISEAMKKEFDYLIEIGSDDVLKNEYLEVISPYLGVNNLIGIDHAAYINAATGACRYIKSKTSFGMGRAVRKSALEKVGKMWSNKQNKGMDKHSTFTMAQAGVLERRISSDLPLGIDIKSDVNIWGWRDIKMLTRPYSLDKALDGLSKEEINAIQCLITKNKSASLIGA